MDKKELNEAIYDVLISQFKKDNLEAFRKVEEAGYIIKKVDGNFRVINPNNIVNEYGRSMYIYCKANNYNSYFSTAKWVSRKFSSKIDFVGCLESKRERYYSTRIESQAIENYQYEIKHPKEMIKSYEENVKNAKEKILDLINDIEKYTKIIQEYENDLKMNRKELGLDKKGD